MSRLARYASKLVQAEMRKKSTQTWEKPEENKQASLNIRYRSSIEDRAVGGLDVIAVVREKIADDTVRAEGAGAV